MLQLQHLDQFLIVHLSEQQYDREVR